MHIYHCAFTLFKTSDQDKYKARIVSLTVKTGIGFTSYWFESNTVRFLHQSTHSFALPTPPTVQERVVSLMVK